MAARNSEAMPVRRPYRILRFLLLWVMLLIVIPLGFLLLLEGALRLAGYGESRVPFVKRTLGNNAFYAFNEAYLNQFYPTPISIDTFAVPPRKAANAYRILIIGGSAAQGWPMPKFAFNTVLELQLRAAFPGVDFQMLNCAVAGLNMNGMRPVVDSAARFDYDMLLVYSGNNEFIGLPYGTDVYSQTGHIPDAATIKWLIAMRNWRLYQWAERAAPRQIKGTGEPLHNVDILKDAISQRIYANYEANLRDVAHLAARAGAMPVYCTVGVNLREWPPYDTVAPLPLEEPQMTALENARKAGDRAVAAGDTQDAIAHYEAALKIYDKIGLVHFQLAHCLLDVGRETEARAHFERAVELDESPFARCRPSQNDTIRRIVAEESATGARLVDVAAALADSAPGGAPGMEYFYDSCHTTFDGTYAIASAIFEGIRTVLPVWVQDHAAESYVPVSRDDAAAYLGYDPTPAREQFERLRANSSSNPPMTGPFIETALSRLRAEEGTAMTDDEALQALQRGVEHLGSCPLLTRSQVEILIRNNRMEEAAQRSQPLLASIPLRRENYLLRGEVLRLGGEPVASQATLEEGIRLLDFDLVILLQLIYAAMDAGHTQAALAWTEEGLRTFTDYPILWTQAYTLYMQTGNPTAAEEAFAQATKKDPPSSDIWLARAKFCKEAGDLAGAREACIKAADITGGDYPSIVALYDVEKELLEPADLLAAWEARATGPEPYACVHYALGKARHDAGDFTGAESALREALARMPEAVWITAELATVLQARAVKLREAGNLEEARRLYAEARQLNPANTAMLSEEGNLLAEMGDTSSALEVVRLAFASAPYDPFIARQLFGLEKSQLTPAQIVTQWQERSAKHPDSAAARLYFALALELDGKPDAALKTLQLVQQASPNLPGLEEALEGLSKPITPGASTP